MPCRFELGHATFASRRRLSAGGEAMSYPMSLTMTTTLPITGYDKWLKAPAPTISPAVARSEKWMAGIEGVRTELRRASGQGHFFAHHWAAHTPAVFPVENSPAQQW